MRLPAITGPSGVLCLVELDNMDELYRQFALTNDDLAPLRSHLRKLLVDVVSELASGVVFGPSDDSFLLLERKHNNAGVVLSLEEKNVITPPESVTKLAQNWSVEHVRGNYGVAALELFYNPGESEALRKKQLVSELYHYCQHEGIDFLLKLIVYPIKDAGRSSEQSMFETQFAAMTELRSFCDAIAVEYFEDPLHAATITTQLDVPWIVFERNVTYETAKETIRVGIENGAQGFIVSDVLWHDFIANLQEVAPTPTVIEQYVKTIVRDRLIELVRIATELYTTASSDTPQ